MGRTRGDDILAYELSELLTPERIYEISTEHGFRPDITEKFLMDYLVHQRVTEGLECITKGGMCMPFYQPDGTLRRLSVDVDLATNLPADSIDSAVRLAKDLPNVTNVKRHTPSRQAVPKNNLVTHNVQYKSCLGLEQSVKVDFLHSLDLDYGTRTVPAGMKIMGFRMPHKMRMLTRSALMADKVGTLAAGTIGLDVSRANEIAKQVFDVGVLLYGSTVGDIAGFFAEFPRMLEAERAIHGKPDLEARTVVDSIGKALNRMHRVTGEMRFLGDAKKGYNDFNSAYISNRVRYQKIDHHTNILSIKVLNHLTGQVLDGRDVGESAARMRQILANVGGVSDYPHVQKMYGLTVREATGIQGKYLKKMNARLSCLLCAHAALEAECESRG